MAQADGSAPARERPLSPHLSVWRWHVTMLGSILHRASGMALYVGAIGFAVWLVALGIGPGAFDALNAFVKSIFGQIIVYGLVACLSYHLANGVRHLAWDLGQGFKPQTADATAWCALAFAALAPVGVWLLAH
jgi:succinate dehydrogenase / fumarate reductase, cytochrome b subunit